MKTLLFIEDDELVRASLARTLRRFYTVIEVATLRQAAAWLHDPEARIDLVLTDYDLPDGTADRLDFGGLPVIVHTGRDPLTLSMPYPILRKHQPIEGLLFALESIQR